MNFYSRILITFLLISTASISWAYGQSQAISDSTYNEYISNAWEEINNSDSPDSLQKKFGEKLFQDYINNSDTKAGKRTISTAFRMWAHAGASNQAEQAMAKLDYDSEIWHDFIPYVKGGYRRSDHKTHEDYIKLLTELRSKLTHPLSKSQVLWMLSDYYHEQNYVEELKATSRQLIELDAEDFFVEYARGMLYETNTLKVGQIAPNFNIKTVIGDSISLSDFKDRIVLLEFWATWCRPCIPEIPHFKNVNSKYSEKNVKLIGISLDQDLNKLKKFIDEKDMSWTQIMQHDKWSGKITELYNVQSIPRNYLIGKDGKIVGKDVEPRNLENKIDSLINK